MRLRYVLLFCIIFSVVQKVFAQAPTVEFIENKGQWGSWFKYKASTPGGEVFLEHDGLRYLLCDPLNIPRMDSFHHGQMTKNPIMKFHVYKVLFEGANPQVEIEGSKPEKTYYNYYLGKDSARWKTGIHPDLAADYNELYDGINMHLIGGHGTLEYEFFVKPGAKSDQIVMNYDGPQEMYTKNGDLVIKTSVGEVMELKPYAYQYINDSKVEVPCSYHLKHNKVSFDFPNDFDHTKTLVIDPIVFWCSFTGSTADNWGFTATYDNAGDLYMAGLVNALAIAGGGSYPVSPGAFQSTFAGGQGNSAIEYGADIGVMKLDPTGASRIYATYIGGSANERPHSLIVDPSDNLIVAGRTHSTDYPITPGTFQTSNAGGWDIVVSKLNSTGTALLGSTYVGGTADDGVNFDSTEVGYGHLKFNYGDDARSEVQIDNMGNIYVAGNTSSTNFPTTAGAISTTFRGGLQDGVAFKLNSTLTSMLWGTYLGGSGDDAAYVIAFNKSQSSVYIAGGTNSTNFPVTTGTWQPSYMGDSADGFILKIKNSPPYNVQRGTYVGTPHYDQVYGVQVDDTGNVYVMGQSLGGTFPVTPGVYTNPNNCQFVMKMDSNLTNDVISTVYGSIPGDPTHTNISPVAFLVDTCNNVYISGWGGNIMGAMAPGLAHTGTTIGMPTTSDGFQRTTDGYDFYFIVLGQGLASMRYATFYGRNAPGFPGEHVDGGTSRFSKQGIIYQAICANCGGTASGIPPFPTTAGVWAPTDMSSNCNEAGLKIAFNIGPVTANVSAAPATNGCAPLTVTFVNTSLNGVGFIWDFGDGSTFTGITPPPHTFVSAGIYTVSLAASNANSCFRTDDTFRLIITVDTGKITPDFTSQLTDSCGPYIASFTNTSTDWVGTASYQWYFGDGSAFTGASPSPHSYAGIGSYTVMLVMSDPAACKTPDTVTHIIQFTNQPMSATFSIPDSVCLGTPITPATSFSNVSSTTWSFGDGTTSTGTNPSHKFAGVGSYTVTLIAANPGGCNGADTLVETITVLSVPTANFSFAPTIPTPNIPTTFTNQSKNATRYSWDFGDNTTSVEENPIHQYPKTATYKACLTAYNQSNCPSAVCKQVPAEIQPLLGLPTAFSPNGDGENDVLYVRGAAIATMDLKIWNRWGQLVFETTDQKIGWDGTFNGQPQPMEAYAYVLNVTFIDGSAKQLKGNITLLR